MIGSIPCYSVAVLVMKIIVSSLRNSYSIRYIIYLLIRSLTPTFTLQFFHWVQWAFCRCVVCPCIGVSVCRSVRILVSLSVYLSASLPVSMCLRWVYLSVPLPACIPVYPFVHPSICLSACLLFCFGRLSFDLSTCRSFHSSSAR